MATAHEAQQTTNGIEKKSLNRPDEVRTFDKGRLEIAKVGKGTIGRAYFEPGWRWSKSVKPIANTPSCQAAHFGYVVAGRMKVVMDGGEEVELAAGDVLDIAPGHDAWVLGDEVCVMIDVTGAENYAKK